MSKTNNTTTTQLTLKLLTAQDVANILAENEKLKADALQLTKRQADLEADLEATKSILDEAIRALEEISGELEQAESPFKDASFEDIANALLKELKSNPVKYQSQFLIASKDSLGAVRSSEFNALTWYQAANEFFNYLSSCGYVIDRKSVKRWLKSDECEVVDQIVHHFK